MIRVISLGRIFGNIIVIVNIAAIFVVRIIVLKAFEFLGKVGHSVLLRYPQALVKQVCSVSADWTYSVTLIVCITVAALAG